MAKEQKTLSVYDDFSCLMDKCPDTCCRGWYIDVEQGLISDWEQLRSDTKQILLQNIVRDDQNRYTLRLNSDNYCAHYDSGLCRLHRDFGTHIMPGVCVDFPRIKAENTFKKGKSLSLACPEATRLVTSSNYQQNIKDESGSSAAKTIEPAGFEYISHALDTLFNLLLRQRKYPLGIRLYWFANSIADVCQAIDAHRLHPGYFNAARKSLGDDLLKLQAALRQGRLVTEDMILQRYWSAILRACIVINDKASLCDQDQLTALAELDETRFIDSMKSLIVHGNPHLKSLSRALHNVFEVICFNYGLPWNPINKNHKQALMHCAQIYSFIHMFSWLACEKNGNFTLEQLQEIVYKVDRVFGHSPDDHDYPVDEIRFSSQCFLALV